MSTPTAPEKTPTAAAYPRPAGRDTPTRVKTLLATLFKEKNWEKQLGLHAVFLFWEEVLGPELACFAQPKLIRGNVLWVRVADSIWMQQLHLQKMLLLEKINARLAKDRLADIRFELDTDLGQPAPAKPAVKPVRQADPEKSRQVDQLLSTLKNQEIRDALKNLWTRMQQIGR
ncbi:MAG: hypothetical protein A2521_08945 [Deltaproteobacteria bacterium RIFOXYD12_FULL_57_12]|nr:MAG: hypothetical protein A2521_08945 [Deltaproteobacteria bacterium RIFOXYD12_FULL_57_12]